MWVGFIFLAENRVQQKSMEENPSHPEGCAYIHHNKDMVPSPPWYVPYGSYLRGEGQDE